MNFIQLYETRDKIKTFLIRAEFASFSLGFKNVMDYLKYSLDHPYVLKEMYPYNKIKEDSSRHLKDNSKIAHDKCHSENVSACDKNSEDKTK